MFADNLIALRKRLNLSQEELASRIGVTRQTLSKWECGESSPDLDRAQRLADVLDVSLDELASEDSASANVPPPKRGKHIFGMVKVGEKGQIVIPARARRIFEIQPGDMLAVLGDENSGIALLKARDFLMLADQLRATTTEGDA